MLHRPRRRLLALVVAVTCVGGCRAEASSDAMADSDARSSAAPSAQDDSGRRSSDGDASIRVDPADAVVEQPIPGSDTEVFVAADLDPSIAGIVRTTLQVARDAWGLRWNMEFWVLGTDPTSAVALVEQFCRRREALGQSPFDACVARESDVGRPHTLLSYQQVGSESLALERPTVNAALNGSPDQRMHWFGSSAPWGLMGRFDVPADDDLRMVFHEAWHAVQSEHLDVDLPGEVREALMGPVWFVEGSAEYMGQYQRARARADRLLPQVDDGDRPFRFADAMRWKLDRIDLALAGECAGYRLIAIVTYDDPCSFLGYEMGAWAIAYLGSITAPDVLLEEFHPRVQEFGWQDAFEVTAGMTLEEFDAAFHRFIAGSTDARMAILPDVGGA